MRMCHLVAKLRAELALHVPLYVLFEPTCWSFDVQSASVHVMAP